MNTTYKLKWRGCWTTRRLRNDAVAVVIHRLPTDYHIITRLFCPNTVMLRLPVLPQPVNHFQAVQTESTDRKQNHGKARLHRQYWIREIGTSLNQITCSPKPNRSPSWLPEANQDWNESKNWKYSHNMHTVWQKVSPDCCSAVNVSNTLAINQVSHKLTATKNTLKVLLNVDRNNYDSLKEHT